MTLFNGTHVQNSDGTGVTSDVGARLAQAGFLAPGSASTSVGIRAGVMPGPYFPGNVFVWSGMFTGVNAGIFVLTRNTSGGAYVLAVDSFTQVPVAHAAAPSSGVRIDIVWVKQQDANAGDSSSQAVFGITQGVASSAPTAPTGSVPVGALPLAHVRIPAFTTSISAANITQVAPYAATRGGDVFVNSVADRGTLAVYPGLRVYRIDLGYSQQWDGSRWNSLKGTYEGYSGWSTMSLYSNWTNAGGDYAPLSWKRDGDTVFLRGRVQPTFDPVSVSRIDFGIVPAEIRPFNHNWSWIVTAKPHNELRGAWRCFYQSSDARLFVERLDGASNFTMGPGGFVQVDGIAWVI